MVGEVDVNLIRQPQFIEAVEKAWTEGEAEGEAKMAEGLLRLFRRRFGTVPEGVELKVRSAPLPDLEAWMDAFPDARKLDDVFLNGRAG